MKYLLILNKEGRYLNEKQDKRYDILECHEANGPRANEFVKFENLEEALKTWGLTEVEDGL